MYVLKVCDFFPQGCLQPIQYQQLLHSQKALPHQAADSTQHDDRDLPARGQAWGQGQGRGDCEAQEVAAAEASDANGSGWPRIWAHRWTRGGTHGKGTGWV